MQNHGPVLGLFQIEEDIPIPERGWEWDNDKIILSDGENHPIEQFGGSLIWDFKVENKTILLRYPFVLREFNRSKWGLMKAFIDSESKYPRIEAIVINGGRFPLSPVDLVLSTRVRLRLIDIYWVTEDGRTRI